MILIADSGSTKTEWRLVDKQNRIQSFMGHGLNPYFHKTEELAATLAKETESFTQIKKEDDLQIFFYGAGCGTDTNREILREALAANFNAASIEVQSDLLGAARALCNKSEGIVGILGTGMSSCAYNGNEITLQQASLGFILGDEGSGAYLGKQLIKDYLSGQLPPDMQKRFESRFTFKPGEIISIIYREPFPNRFLASFSKFIYQNISEQYCVDLVSDAFREFFVQHISRYPGYGKQRLSCCGSVAFWFSNILRRVAEEKGQTLDKVIENPMAGLCLYHLGEDFTVG
jgi:glucosamine kinase